MYAGKVIPRETVVWLQFQSFQILLFRRIAVAVGLVAQAKIVSTVGVRGIQFRCEDETCFCLVDATHPEK